MFLILFLFFPLFLFFVPPQYLENKELESVMLSSGMITDRIERMAFDIVNIYEKERSIHMLCVLKGAGTFYHELIKHMQTIIRSRESKLALYFEYIKVGQ